VTFSFLSIAYKSFWTQRTGIKRKGLIEIGHLAFGVYDDHGFKWGRDIPNQRSIRTVLKKLTILKLPQNSIVLVIYLVRFEPFNNFE
jgi:hypothetical protein